MTKRQGAVKLPPRRSGAAWRYTKEAEFKQRHAAKRTRVTPCKDGTTRHRWMVDETMVGGKYRQECKRCHLVGHVPAFWSGAQETGYNGYDT